MNPKPRQRWADLAALASLAALAIAFFWKIALTNRVLAGVDVLGYFYPYRDLVSAALREGHLPVWNPYLFMGAPLLANSQAAVLYPLHWPLLWLSVPKQVAWSIVFHIILAGAGVFLFARRAVRLPALPAWVAAVVFAFGGFLDAQAEHLNQLNASAWLPWLLLCLHWATANGGRRWLAVLGGSAAVALTLLAGHTQAAYIVFSAALLYAVVQSAWDLRGRRGRLRLASFRSVASLALMELAGAAMAAGQLLPTIELSRLSVRSGGLPYREAASFSLKPGLVFKALLPPLLWEPPFSEYVAYLGILGLILAGIGAWTVLRHRFPSGSASQDGHSDWMAGSGALVLAGIGLFLAFGAYNPVYYVLFKVVPGFDLFRAPARWLLLYSFGAAILAGIGCHALTKLKGWQVSVALLLVIELLAARRDLAYNKPTAPAAFASMRSAVAHLLADDSAAPFRFLSMSDIRYDPGDLGDLQAMYGDTLGTDELYDLVVASKMKEVLSYNLPALYRLQSVDGYDGGLLPTARYVTLERLFLPEEDIWPDGRLRQQLRAVPSARLLSLLNVKYIVTDKVQDVWIDDVFYDLEHTVALGEVTIANLPDLETTHLGVISYLTGSLAIADGQPVAELSIRGSGGEVVTATLRAGIDTAEGLYQPGRSAHRQARVGHHWRDNEQGNDYVAVLPVGLALHPVQVTVRSLLTGPQAGSVQLRGLTLIDRRTGASRSLCVDPAYRLVHSGDVKVYENVTIQPRAFVAYQGRVVPSDEGALALLQDPDFDPSKEVILAGGEALDHAAAAAAVQIVSYQDDRIELVADLAATGYLVLTDAYYPGWKMEVDGQPAALERADVYFRAVRLEAGVHRIVMHYRSATVLAGLVAGVAAWTAWAALLVIKGVRIGRRKPSRV